MKHSLSISSQMSPKNWLLSEYLRVYNSQVMLSEYCDNALILKSFGAKAANCRSTFELPMHCLVVSVRHFIASFFFFVYSPLRFHFLSSCFLLPGTSPRVNERTRWNFADRYSLATEFSVHALGTEILSIDVTSRTPRVPGFLCGRTVLLLCSRPLNRSVSPDAHVSLQDRNCLPMQIVVWWIAYHSSDDVCVRLGVTFQFVSWFWSWNLLRV